jgi:glycerol kinase
VQRTSGNYPGRHPRLLTGIVLRDTGETVYTLEGTVNGAGAALAWAEAELGLENVAEQLAEWLESAGEPPLFLNGIGGLGAPFWVADFESRFVGEGADWQRAVAVAESIVFLIQANLDEFRKAAAPLGGIIASGGLAGVDPLCQRLSDLSGLPLHRPVEHEATARGLAWLLAGKPRDWPEPEFGTWFKPRANPALRERYARWRALMNEATGY